MKPLGFGAALRLGLSNAVSLWRGTVLVFLTRALDAMLGPLMAASFLAQPGFQIGRTFRAGGALVWLGSLIVRGLVLAASVRQGRMRLMKQEPDSLLGEGLAIVHRALPFLVLWFGVDLMVRAWTWLALGAAGVGYFASLFSPQGGVLFPSLAFALVLVVAPLFGVAAVLWCEVGFVRCLRRDAPAATALYDAAGALSRRLAAPFGIWLFTAFLSAVLSGLISGIAGQVANPWEPGAPVMWALVAQLLAAVTAAFLPAVLEVGRLHAFLALDLDETGELPRPPPPVPVAPLVPVTELPLAPVIRS